MKNNVLYYSIGALLYCPANKESIANSIISESFGHKFSLALCLEDTIKDTSVAQAEQTLISSLHKIFTQHQIQPFYLPKIFIRVRNPEQIPRLIRAFGQSVSIVTGFIIPKFNVDNAKNYIKEIIRANELVSKNIYVMPIYENASMIDLRTRMDTLYTLKDALAQIEDRVLNIRVGGNDLCHIFGFRRHDDESIHRIKPVSDIFSDIVTVYGTDYVVSGPVWEYYASDNWEKGLTQEIKDDKLCGFIGKTAIHPNQIPVINKMYQVSKNDFKDAKEILNWNENSAVLVSGSSTKERMNEYKTHSNWAQKILYLAQYFGVTG